MKILVINAGSSSLKYQLFNMTNESVLVKGSVDRIGFESSICKHDVVDGEEHTEVTEILDHTSAIRKVLELLTHEEHGVLEHIDEIEAVGHRVVHGGEVFSSSVIVDDEVLQEIRRLFDLAPLHNPAHIKGIDAVTNNIPGTPQVVVFDTAFHQTMPPKAFMYALPKVLYSNHKVRRYGFHGTSHHYVSEQAAKLLNQDIKDLKIVTCHIGNGVSCTAIKHGQSVDTSMGMTPLEGCMMGTRSGDLDPAIVPYVMGREELTMSEVNSMLNKHSGLIAISGLSSDMREIISGVEEGDKNATLAFEMYEYRLRKYVGAYAAAMNGIDALVFTAGVGENSSFLRARMCEELTYLGLELDPARNEDNTGEDRIISTDQSRVSVLVIPTNEELVIARDTYELIAK